MKNPWGVSVPPPTEAEFFNAARPTTFLLVEGGSDEKLWLAHVDARRCKVRAMSGRENVLAELETVRAEGKGGFVAVLDADYDRIEDTLPEDPRIAWTDHHDLEMLLFASPALEKLLAMVGSADKLAKFEAAKKQTVRDALLSRALPVARLRWLSRRDALALTFRKSQRDGDFKFIDYHDFCGRSGWELDPVQLMETVINFSGKKNLKADDLLRRMKALPEVDAWQLCVGHDLVGLLTVGLRTKLGSRTLSMEDLQERLSLAFERAHLERTEMFAALRTWERDNPPFKVFSS